jgi:DNA repair protein RadC
LGEWQDGRLLLGLSQAAIQRRAGCTERQARRIKASLRLCLLSAHAPPKYQQKITGPESAANLVRGLAWSDVERFLVVALGPEAEVLGIREVGRGSIHQCSIAPRSVFQFLLDVRAHRGFVAHNHPSGSLIASDADRFFTARLVELGAEMGLPIIDHLVITRGGFNSAAQEGWHDF